MPALPPNAALLLDLDGTLLDLAATPDAVVMPPDLPETLRRLRLLLSGAVAIVTGRPIAQVDALLGDAVPAIAGEHGGAIRHGPGLAAELADLHAPPAEWLAEAELLAAATPGVLLEHKARGFVLHYRQAPQAGPGLHLAMLNLLGPHADRFAVLGAHMAWEIRPQGADKGSAVAALMARAPFAGRTPVYIGDDVTDEDGIAAARALGGVGWRVQEVFAGPSGVRDWLVSCARGDTK